MKVQEVGGHDCKNTHSATLFHVMVHGPWSESPNTRSFVCMHIECRQVFALLFSLKRWHHKMATCSILQSMLRFTAVRLRVDIVHMCSAFDLWQWWSGEAH